MIDECFQLQQEEWQVLEAVYPDYILQDFTTNDRIFAVQVSPQFPGPRKIQIDSHLGEKSEVSVSTLPPIILRIALPETYPLSNPPVITSLITSGDWIPRNVIEDALTNAWTNTGEGVLCTWVELLQNGDFLPAADTIRLVHPTPKALVSLLQACESEAQSEQFSKSSFFCSLCLNTVKGTRCLQLSCNHIFCRSCLEEYWAFLITEGNVEKVGCPNEACVKAGREATREEVLRVVDANLVERFTWLKEKNRLEKDPTTVHCPIPFCQQPVAKPPQDDANAESGWNRLRTCGKCNYSFCAFCKRTWHGPLSHCPLSATESFVAEYIALPEGDVGRQKIELRYGRSNVLRLVAQYEEEQANREWFKNSTMPCPGCEARIEKTVGCNHMTCGKCGVHFCYLCGTKVRATDPYAHFATKGLECYGKLFGQETDPWLNVAVD